MSKIEELVRIQHMLDAGNQVLKLTKHLDEQQFASDELVSLAVTRLLEIIGEAARNISEDLRRKYPEIPWQQLIATRNRLIHAYINVDLGIIWHICQKSVPRLVSELDRIVSLES